VSDRIAKNCDVCGVEKKETNHWLVAITHPQLAGIMFVPADVAVQTGLGAGIVREDICGQACSSKRLSQWLESLTATPAAERQTA
jgi:hypothetical protein